MVVLKPMLEGERMLTCNNCNHLGLGSPIRERTSFYRVKDRGYRNRCRRCSCEAAHAWRSANPERSNQRHARRRKERLANPELLEEQRRKDRAHWLQNKNNPRVRAQRREAASRYRERHKERLRDEYRIDSRLRRERAGKWKPPEPEQLNDLHKSGIRLPAEPVSNWVCHLIELEAQRLLTEGKLAAHEYRPTAIERRAISIVTDQVGITSRRVYSLRIHERGSVDLLTVDTMVTNHGGVTIEEIYRDYGNGYSIVLTSDWMALKIYHWGPEE